MDALTIKKEIREGIRLYGEYTYHDKGPGEVVNLWDIEKELRKLSGEEISKIFVELLNIEKEYGEEFVSAVLVDLQDLPEEKFDDILKEPEIKILF